MRGGLKEVTRQVRRVHGEREVRRRSQACVDLVYMLTELPMRRALDGAPKGSGRAVRARHEAIDHGSFHCPASRNAKLTIVVEQSYVWLERGRCKELESRGWFASVLLPVLLPFQFRNSFPAGFGAFPL